MGDAADDAEADPPPATAAKRAASYASKSAKQQKRNGVPDDFFVYGNRYRLEEPSNAFRELKYGPGVRNSPVLRPGGTAPRVAPVQGLGLA